MAVPPSDQVDLLEVRREGSEFGDVRPTHQILERPRIEAFLALMQRINAEEREFEHEFYTYPCSAFTVSVGCRGDCVAVFWISPGHVGGRSPLEGERFLQPITEGEWRQIAGILGIPTDYDTRQAGR